MAASCYITFPTIYFAIRAESVLKNQPWPYKMVPVPRCISSSCGTALRCRCEDIKLVRDFLVHHKLELEGFYRLEEEEGLRSPVAALLDLDKAKQGE